MSLVPRDQPGDVAARALAHETSERRFMEYRRVLHGSDGLTDDALVLALDHQARFVTAIREMCERDKRPPPYGTL